MNYFLSVSIILKMIGFLKSHIQNILCISLLCSAKLCFWISSFCQYMETTMFNGTKNIESCCWNWIYLQSWLQLILWWGPATLPLNNLSLCRFSSVLHAVNFSFKLILISVRTVIFLVTRLLTRGNKNKVNEITSFQLCKCPIRINKKNKHNAWVTQSLM